MDSRKDDLTGIYKAAIGAVDPYALVMGQAEFIKRMYTDGGFARLAIAGFGKASYAMAKAMEDYFVSSIEDGIIITKYGHALHEGLGRFKTFEAGHPLPDENGLKATDRVLELAERADEKTLLVCLISGGGSALLVSPCNGISLKDKQNATDLLLKSGADIGELNTVRKHISKVKGGRLAEIAFPSTVMSLMISDVIGDLPDVIASGPTSPDSTSYADAIGVLTKYSLLDDVPSPVTDILQRGMRGELPDTPKKDSIAFERVKNIVIGNNDIALNAALLEARRRGYEAEIIKTGLSGNARDAARWLADRAKDKASSGARRLCLISGGETTVNVKGKGLGGRNMELALGFALEISGMAGITLLSTGTDGTDGPTDAAGAIVDGNTVQNARSDGLSPEDYLYDNGSYDFFRQAGGLFITGPTGTNVMDVQIIVIE